MRLAFGYVFIRNATFYFPYISNSTLDSWASNPQESFVHNVTLPDIGLNDVRSFSIGLVPNDTNFYISFPQLTMADIDLDLMVIDDWILQYNTLNLSTPIGEEVKRMQNYTEDDRINGIIGNIARQDNLDRFDN